MLSLEQVQLLESRVAKAIEYVRRVNDENAALSSERAGLLSKLEASQKRLDELEMLVMRFKEDQGRIEDGILAALERLSQFEEAFESSLTDKVKTSAPKTAPKKEAVSEKKKQDVPKEDFELDEDPVGTEVETESEKKDAELDIF